MHLINGKMVTDMKPKIIIIDFEIIINKPLNDNHKPFTRISVPLRPSIYL